MKTYKKLYDKFIDMHNLRIAFKKAFKATKTGESLRYLFHLENELIYLQQKLFAMAYKPEPYRYFMIYEPKEREISIAGFTDRIVHHALINILEPIYEPMFIDQSYATRKNKGQHKAVFQAQKYLKNNYWFLKCDIRKYFYSIDHEILLNIIGKHIKDIRLMDVIAKIFANAGDNKGLPIGNLTSQFFANVYLNGFDHYVKRELKAKNYLRYMDDFVLFSNDKNELKTNLNKIRDYLHTMLKLELKEEVVLINNSLHGLSYLGTRIYPKTIRIRQQNKKRIFKRLQYRYHLYKRGKITQNEYMQTANSVFAHINNYNGYQLCKNYRYMDAEL